MAVIGRWLLCSSGCLLMFHCILHLIPVEQLIIIVVAMHNCTIDSKMESVTLYDKCVTLVAYKVQKGCVGVEKMGSCPHALKLPPPPFPLH